MKNHNAVAVAIEQVKNIFNRSVLFLINLDRAFVVIILQGFEDIFPFPNDHPEIGVLIVGEGQNDERL
jgi:hypothetical protein